MPIFCFTENSAESSKKKMWAKTNLKLFRLRNLIFCMSISAIFTSASLSCSKWSQARAIAGN